MVAMAVQQEVRGKLFPEQPFPGIELEYIADQFTFCRTKELTIIDADLIEVKKTSIYSGLCSHVFEAAKTCDHTFTDDEVHALCRAYSGARVAETA